MTTLEAVNRILSAAGLFPVPALDTGGSSSAANAERVLDEKELEIQSRGWHYNTRVNVELEPDATTSQIPIPTAAITIDSDRYSLGTDVSPFGQFLYDRWRNVFTFDGPIIATYTLRYQFDCIPHPIAVYIADLAALEFNENWGSPKKQRALEARLRKSQGAAHRFDGDSEDTNILDTAHAHYLKGERGR